VAAEQPLSPFTRQRIARLAEAALHEAGVVGEYPTPIAAVLQQLGVRERLDISRLPAELEARKPAGWKRVLGAVLLKERTVFVDRSQPEPRQLFTDAHEATHVMCDWHEATLLLDNEETLFREAKIQVELEAGFGAAQLIFQGGRFHRRALHEQVSMRTPLALAGDYGASRHATLHHYAEDHPDAVALLVSGRYPYCDQTLPIWRSVESQAFRQRFGPVRQLLPGQQLSVAEDALLGEILIASRTALDPPSKVIGVPDRDGRKVPFVAEAFFNQHCHFVMLIERRARLLGRRVRLAG
jgi:hypothetical protein